MALLTEGNGVGGIIRTALGEALVLCQQLHAFHTTGARV